MNIDPTALADRLNRAVELSREAGRHTLQYFRQDSLSVDRKADGTPLTIADREAETLLRREIESAFPEDQIVGEEFDNKPGTSGWGWILDPIDGTKSFISGVPLYGTMVAVEQVQSDSAARQAVIGAVYFPGLDEGIYASRGNGAFAYHGSQPPRRAHVSQQTNPADGVLVTTSVTAFTDRGAERGWQRLAKKFSFARTWGDVYGYYLVATGRVEAMVDPALNVWDAAAVQPILEEAGGRYSDWRGNLDINGGDGIGSNGLVHEAILEALREGQE